MRRAACCAFALLSTASAGLGQTSYVVNALQRGPVNVLAPQMRATVYEVQGASWVSDSPASQARVFIRPSGAATATAAIVVGATGGASPTATFVVPAGVRPGQAELYWQIGSGAFRFMGVTVARSNLALGVESAVLKSDGTTQPVTALAPARPGQTVVLTGSGLGYGQEVTATIGGAPARLVYAGHGPSAGFDTIQVEVPAGVAGCYLTVTVRAGESVGIGRTSVSGDGLPCSPTLPLSNADLRTVEGGGSVASQTIFMTTTLNVTSTGAASREGQLQLGGVGVNAASLAGGNAASEFGCQVVYSTSGWFNVSVNRAAFPLGALADGDAAPLGEAVTLSNARASYVLRAGAGSYFLETALRAEEASFATVGAGAVTDGAWRLTWPGSGSLAASAFTFTLPKAPQLKDEAVVRIARGEDRVISWSGAGVDARARVTVTLSGTAESGKASRQVQCVAPAEPGSVTVPAALLGGFDAGSIGAVRATVTLWNGELGATRLVTSDGAPLLLMVNYTANDIRVVEFQ